MRAKINPVGVFPEVAAEICINAVEQKTEGGSKVSWHLLDDNEQPLVWGDAEVGDEAHQSWGSSDESPVLNLTLAKLGLTAVV